MKNSLTPEELFNLWKKGKSLYSGLNDFTNSTIKKQYESIESEKNKNRNALIGKTLSGFSETLLAGINSLNKSNQLSNELIQALDKLKYDLLNKIITEKLIGLGYEAPIKSSDFPKIIPLYIWPQKINEINWENSSISHNGIQFLNIRIIKKIISSNMVADKKIILPEIPIKNKKIGRPSIKSKIISAYEHLKKENKIDYSKALKAHTELIQKTVQILFPEIKNTKGMEYEAIRRTLTNIFQEDKTSKSTSKL